MAKIKLIYHHESSQRDTWWHLIQDENGGLHVEHENDNDPTQGTSRWTLNEALEQGLASPALQKLVDRMFEDRNADRT
jgi:hypothetical protein